MGLFARGFEDTLRYFDFPEHMWVSLRTNNPIEQFIGKVRDWTGRFNYFQGRANLELALYTYICHKNRGLVPESLYSQPDSQRAHDQIPTLSVA